MANGPDLQPLLQVKSDFTRRFLRRDRSGLMLRRRSLDGAVAAAAEGLNVHAIGVGRKVTEGVTVDELAVKVYVSQKLPTSLLGNSSIPEEVDGVPTDVVESPPAFVLPAVTATAEVVGGGPPALSAFAASACSTNRKSRLRPVPAGVSTGHFSVTAGTIACFCHSVRAGDDPEEVYLLSNNHVYADVNNGSPGDPLLQQGAIDGGTPADQVGRLARFVPLDLSGIAPNLVDAAIGDLLPGVAYDPEICSLGRILGTLTPVEGMRVSKHGRTTGLTEGKITDISYDALVGMDHMDPSVVALFEDQIRIERVAPYPAFGLGGDSGSLVVTSEGRKAVGLYFAGPESGFYGVANPIDKVLSELEIALI